MIIKEQKFSSFTMCAVYCNLHYRFNEIHFQQIISSQAHNCTKLQNVRNTTIIDQKNLKTEALLILTLFLFNHS
jgi:hypothetical protein